jgi:hypothetical protein
VRWPAGAALLRRTWAEAASRIPTCLRPLVLQLGVMAAATPAAALPPLKTVTNKVSQKPEYLFMCTNNTSMTKNESLFKSADGALIFK